MNKTVAGYVQSLKETADPIEIVRNSGSLVTYLGIPQTKAAFPTDIAARLDSMAVGSTSAPVENKLDNTINVVKLISKVQLPDSVQFRAIQVGGATPADAAKTADSIFTALKSGAEFEAIAKIWSDRREELDNI